MTEATGSKPMWGKCDGCGHCWPIVYLPMEMRHAAKLIMAARCPRCGGSRVFAAKQTDGVLEEPDAARFTQIATDGGSHVSGA